MTNRAGSVDGVQSAGVQGVDEQHENGPRVSASGASEQRANDQRVNEQYASAQRKLLASFDAFCEQNGIKYFAIEETLIGAVTYGDFISGDYRLKLGMLRAEFEKLRAFVGKNGEITGLAAGNTPIRLECDIRKAMHWGIGLMPGYAEALADVAVAEDAAAAGTVSGAATSAAGGAAEAQAAAGTSGSSADVAAAELRPHADLHVFDAATDDYDLTTFQRWREEVWMRLRAKMPASLRPAIEKHAEAIARSYENTPHDEVALTLELRRRRYPLAYFEHPYRIPFGPAAEGGHIGIPNETCPWIETDAQAEANRVAHVQGDVMRILHEVDRVCRAHDIHYFLAAGTLLGAMRHGGFIPWDDDIDIGMLREDYDRFIEVAPEALAPGFFMQNRTTDPDAEYLFTKVRLLGTEYVTEYTRYRTQEKGISLDIFPFDRASVESPDFPAFADEAARLIKAHRAVARHRVTDEYPHRRARTLMEALGHRIMKWRNKPFDTAALAKTQRAYEKHVTSHNDDPSATHAVSYVTYLTYLPLADLQPYGEMKFEDGSFPVPGNPDSLMIMQFGESYLQEPPEHQRHAHPIISWRTLDGTCG